MDRTNQDVIGEICVRNDAGELSLSDEQKMKAWVEHCGGNDLCLWPKILTCSPNLLKQYLTP